MTKIIIGCDPDSNKHGIAEYWDGKLVNLRSMRLMDLRDLLEDIRPRECIEIHIEDVCGISYSGFHVRAKDPLPVKLKKAENVGMCKQAQREVEYLAEYLGIKIVKHRISKRWKSQQGKVEFEKITGWTGRSNEDTRSGAHMGYLGIK